MADDLNRLLIKIQADTSQLASALKAAEAGVANTSARLERTVNQNASRFKKWGDELSGQFKRLAAGYVGLELVSKGLESVGVVAQLEDQAKAAGLTTDQFQELAYAARISGASTDDLAKGLDRFSQSVAQVRLNTGQFNEFLKDQAPALRDALAATTSQRQAVSVLADAMAGLGDDSQRATLLQQAFGSSSRELIGVLSDGSAALDKAGQDAEAFGVVITKDYIEKAKEASAQFANLELVATTTFEKMAVSAASWATSFAQSLAHPLDSLGKLLDEMHSVSGAAMGGVGARGRSPMAQAEGNNNLTLAQTTKGWDATVQKAPTWALQPKPDNTGRDALANLQKQFDESNGNIQQALQDQYDQELKQWQDMLDKKQISEAQFAEARTQLGIVMLNAQKENLGAETQMQREYYTQTRDLIDSTFMDAFANALETGKFKASQFFAQLLQGFAKITMEVLVLKPLIDGLFNGMSGGLGGGLGSLFGGFLASGGPANANTPYIVGEKGPELFVPNGSGRVKNARETADIFTPSLGNSRVGNSISNNSTVIHNTIDARGADVGVADRIAKALNSQRQQSPVATMRQAAKRFPTRG